MTEADGSGIEPPVLPRQRRIPRRIDHGISQSQHSDERVEDLCRRIYFATVDSAIACLSQRFKSPAFKMACDIETLFMDVINTAHHAHDWQASEVIDNILSHYENDIDGTRLRLNLSMLGDLCRSAQPRVSVADTSDVIQLFSENEAWTQILPEVTNLLRLYLTLPVTSCTAERSFKRSTVTQKRLNHIALLHCHRVQSQSIDFEVICNSFILRNDIKQATFAVFPKK